MEIYAKWPIVYSDKIGFEARRNPLNPEEYGINQIGIYGNKIIPMLLLPRGILPDIATMPLNEGNSSIERIAHQTNIYNEEFEKLLENAKKSKRDGVDILNAFIKGTYIKLAREGKIII